jgi:hypothetical protein
VVNGAHLLDVSGHLFLRIIKVKPVKLWSLG